MTSYVALIRGINVGGRSPVGMTDLVAAFRKAGYANVRTHGQSGNVLFETDRTGSAKLESAIEKMLEDRLGISTLVVIRSRTELAATVAAAPADHGSKRLRSDVFFLKQPLKAEAVLAEIPELRDGVDSIAIGPSALYFSRVAAQATKTRIQRFMAMPVFQQVTVRTWRVTTRLLELLEK